MPAPIDMDPDRPSIDSHAIDGYGADFFDGMYSRHKLHVIILNSSSSFHC